MSHLAFDVLEARIDFVQTPCDCIEKAGIAEDLRVCASILLSYGQTRLYGFTRSGNEFRTDGTDIFDRRIREPMQV